MILTTTTKVIDTQTVVQDHLAATAGETTTTVMMAMTSLWHVATIW